MWLQILVGKFQMSHYHAPNFFEVKRVNILLMGCLLFCLSGCLSVMPTLLERYSQTCLKQAVKG